MLAAGNVLSGVLTAPIVIDAGGGGGMSHEQVCAWYKKNAPNATPPAVFQCDSGASKKAGEAVKPDAGKATGKSAQRFGDPMQTVTVTIGETTRTTVSLPDNLQRMHP